MKFVFSVTKIDEEKLKTACNEGTAESKELASKLCGFVHIFNLDYDPKIEGYRTVKEGYPVPDTKLATFNRLIDQIGATATKIGSHY